MGRRGDVVVFVPAGQGVAGTVGIGLALLAGPSTGRACTPALDRASNATAARLCLDAATTPAAVKAAAAVAGDGAVAALPRVI